jgi:hypothetical protein
MTTRLRIGRIVVEGLPRDARVPGLKAEIERALSRRLAGQTCTRTPHHRIAADVAFGPAILPHTLAARIAEAIASALTADPAELAQ